jgi:hypothetical protein
MEIEEWLRNFVGTSALDPVNRKARGDDRVPSNGRIDLKGRPAHSYNAQ